MASLLHPNLVVQAPEPESKLQHRHQSASPENLRKILFGMNRVALDEGPGVEDVSRSWEEAKSLLRFVRRAWAWV